MKLIEEMEQYAQLHEIPIMQKEGIEFFQKILMENKCKTVLEIGSAIGYSAIQLARLDPQIHIVTIERDEDRYKKAVENIERSGLSDQIELIYGDALVWDTQDKFDCIFIDAAKAQYIRFFERYEKNLNEDGIIVSDNLSFHGYVENPTQTMSRNLKQLVRKIKGYIEFLEKNEDYETLFIKEGDGLAISRKKKINMIK